MKRGRYWWVAAAIWFGCWIGLWVIQGLIFPQSEGEIGSAIGFFGGAYLGGRVADYLERN